MVFLSR